MAIYDERSRYIGLPMLELTSSDGVVRRVGPLRRVPEPHLASSYRVQPGDRLDLLGEAATTDSTRWWVLADANPWADATVLERPGLIIEVPDA